MPERISLLVISPHQDDETIGCGGLIQKVLELSGEVAIAFGTMVGHQYMKYDKNREEYSLYNGATRLDETIRALDVLGQGSINHHILLEEEYHHKLDTLPIVEVIRKIEEIVVKVKPNILAIPAFSWDQDHQVLHRACHAVSRPHFYNRIVMEYEVNGETDYHPNFYLQLSEEHMTRKLKALECYKTQQSGELHRISQSGLKNRAEFRGKEAYLSFAESFHIRRFVL